MAAINRRNFVLGFSGLVGLGACTRRIDAEDAAVLSLRGGGHVIFFRHTATDRPGTDLHTWPRERQRLLSDKGMEDARHIGERFRAIGIPVEEVRASPFARCTDMAQLAFGHFTVEPHLLPPESAGGPPDRSDWLQRIFAEPREGRGNLVLIAHSSNMMLTDGLGLNEGETALVRPTGSGGYVVTGVVGPAGW